MPFPGMEASDYAVYQYFQWKSRVERGIHSCPLTVESLGGIFTVKNTALAMSLNLTLSLSLSLYLSISLSLGGEGIFLLTNTSLCRIKEQIGEC